MVTAALGDLKRHVRLVYSTSCLIILPGAIDKGEGIRFLSDYTGTPLSRMLGVGDSDVDKQFLLLVGYSACACQWHCQHQIDRPGTSRHTGPGRACRIFWQFYIQLPV
jgi:hypothetical protein